jgi:ABC-2 type transport system permease protein
MQVFKAYFKIIKKNMPQMYIFLGIFAALSVAFSSVGVGKATVEFTNSKPDIAVFSQDADTPLMKGFIAYLESNASLVSIANTDNGKQDALFFRKVVYILQIPAGYTDSLLNNGAVQLARKTVPDSMDSTYVDYLITKYINAVKAYTTYAPQASQEQIVQSVAADLSKNAVVTMKEFGVKKAVTNNSVYFFNYFAYSLFAIIMLGVSSFMLTFQDTDLRRRNTASPMTLRSMNTQLVMGNAVFAFAVWGILYSLAFVLFRESLLNISAVYYAINTILYTLVCVSISFLVGNLARSRNAQSAIVNVLALGLSFISGVFVPQSMLGETVLRIASFTPTYWYIRANLLIEQADTASAFNIQFMTTEIGMQLVFTIVLFAIAVVIIRKRRTSNS